MAARLALAQLPNDLVPLLRGDNQVTMARRLALAQLPNDLVPLLRQLIAHGRLGGGPRLRG